MKKFAIIALFAFGLMVSLARADSVNIDGRDWEAIPDGGGGTSYAVDGGVLTLTGNWARWIHAYTAISVGVGDVVEFDMELTKGGDSWIGDAGWVLQDSAWTHAQRGLYFNDPAMFNDYVAGASAEVGHGTDVIIHVFIEFVSESDYRLTVDNGTQNHTFENSFGNGLTVSDISTFLFSSWDTQQDISVSNFYVGPALPGKPAPANNSDNAPIDVELGWNAPIGWSPVGYELYLRAGDPNFPDSSRNILDGVSVDATQTDPVTYAVESLDFTTTYYWRVDSNGVDPNSGKTISSEGKVWSFTSVSAAPMIVTYDNVVTAVGLADAVLSAVVYDADNNIQSVSWELLSDDYEYPTGAVASISATGGTNEAPTATLSTNSAGAYKVKLVVTDADGNSDEALAKVQVFETTCDAAQMMPDWAGFDPMDIDTDCDIDVDDLAAFAGKWLSDISLSDAETYSGVPSYLPGYGIPNGGFEVGSLQGWASINWNGALITDFPPDVFEGDYAAFIHRQNGGVTAGALWLEPGSYSITLWYKGTIPTVGWGFDGNMTSAGYTITAGATDGIMVSGVVPDFTQFTLEFDVNTAGNIGFYAWGWNEGSETGFMDDIRLNSN